MTPLASKAVQSPHRRLRRWVLGTSGALALSTAAIGVLHTPFARPLMMRLGGCPMAGVHMTVAQTDNARHMGLVGNVGTASAPARPALGFQLDKTTQGQVRAWAARTHVDCTDLRDGVVQCTNVSPVAISRPADEGPVDELVLAFNPQDHLVNITTLRRHLRPDVAARAAKDIASGLASELGPAAKSGGDFEAARLSQTGAASIGTVSYRYSDYVVDVIAMNLPSSGPSIREHYMSAND